VAQVCVRTLQSNTGAFQKVGECLYRYSNGVYYGRIRVDGKEIKRSLRTKRAAIIPRVSVELRRLLTFVGPNMRISRQFRRLSRVLATQSDFLSFLRNGGRRGYFKGWRLTVVRVC
jgi:hypothetical protein